MTRPKEALPVRIGRALGEWNDARYSVDRPIESLPWHWRSVDAVAGWLYTWGERRG